MYLCVCEREKEGERESVKEIETTRERKVCVFMHVILNREKLQKSY